MLSAAVGWLLRRSRLPSAPPLQLDSATDARYAAYTCDVVDSAAGAIVDPPGPVADYLRYLARSRSVLFHGTQHDLTELQPLQSNDVADFGNQQAVYASSDPLWSMFFALVLRGPTFRSMRNGSMSTLRVPEHRFYFLSVDVGEADSVTQPGWIHVVPKDGFTAQPPFLRLVDSAQWASTRSVKPIARFAVAPEDYPLLAAIRRHTKDESMPQTVWRSRRR